MFDLGPEGEVVIGDYGVVYGPHFVGNVRVEIGDFAYISYEVYIADSTAPVPGLEDVEPISAARPPPDIVIGDDCWIGLRSVILPGTRLGRGVIVGAGAVVDFAVPDFAVVAGSPGHIVGTVTPGEGTRGTQEAWWSG